MTKERPSLSPFPYLYIEGELYMEEAINCLISIKTLYPSFSKSERKIADYILACPSDVINMNVGQLSRQIHVAQSSVIRFCQTIGLEGFAALKINLAKHLTQNQEYVLDEITMETDNGHPKLIASKVFSSVSRSLEETLALLSNDVLEKTVELLCNAEKIMFFGVGTSATIASDTYYRFMRIGLPAYAATDPHIMLLSASLLNPNCVAFGISHTGRTVETIRAMEVAQKSGAHTICITSYGKSPITKYCDIPIVTSASENKLMQEAITSRIIHVALMDSLYTCVSLRKYDEVKEKIENMHQLLEGARLIN